MLDLTTLLPGPLATLMLAEAGADVLKVEPPGGEDMRRVPPMRGGVSMLFTMLNRGKRGIELDLKAPAGKAALEALVREADVLVEQFRPGVLARLGFGAERLSELNPGLITCAITGYGQEGPRRDEPGHDLNYISQTGLLAMSPGTREAPTLPPALIADIAGGSFPAVINILLALRLRDRTGKGQHIDVAMTDAMFTLAFWGLAMLEDSGAAPRPGAELFSGALPRYRLYPAACGRLVAVGALEDKFWIRFADLIELPKNLREDHVDPEATAREVARLIAGQTGLALATRLRRSRLLRRGGAAARRGRGRSALHRARAVRGPRWFARGTGR